MSRFPYVQIAVSLPLDGLYTYSVPKGMSLEVGHAVLVPFGKQKVSGYVIEFLVFAFSDTAIHGKSLFANICVAIGGHLVAVGTTLEA